MLLFVSIIQCLLIFRARQKMITFMQCLLKLKAMRIFLLLATSHRFQVSLIHSTSINNPRYPTRNLVLPFTRDDLSNKLYLPLLYRFRRVKILQYQTGLILHPYYTPYRNHSHPTHILNHTHNLTRTLTQSLFHTHIHFPLLMLRDLHHLHCHLQHSNLQLHERW